MLASFVLLVASQISPVTLDIPIQRLDATVKTLAERTGQNLVVAPNLGGEMVFVRVKDAPLDTVLAKIAYCTHAGWVREGTRIRLERSPVQERDLALAADEHRAQELRKTQSAMRAKPDLRTFSALEEAAKFRAVVTAMAPVESENGSADTFDSTAFQTNYEKATSALPAQWILRQIGPKLDLTGLTKGPENRALVFSTDPWGTERPFPAELLPIIDRYRQSQTAFFGALSGWPEAAKHISTDPIERILVHAAATRLDGGEVFFGLEVHALSAANREVAQGMMQLGAEAPSPSDPVPVFAPPQLKLSPVAAKLEKAYAFGEDQKVVPGSDVDQILRNPDRWSRFQFAWSEVLPALLPAPNLVANLSDAVEENLVTTNGVVDLSDTYQILGFTHEMKREEAWATVRPRYPAAAGTDRHHRPTFARLIRAIADQYPIAIEQAAAIPPRDRDSGRLQFHPFARGAMVGSHNMDLLIEDEPLRLLGALEPNVRNRLLRTGGTLAWSEFGTALKKLVRYQLFEGSSLPIAQPPRVREENSPDGLTRDLTILHEAGGPISQLNIEPPLEKSNYFIPMFLKAGIDPDTRIIPDMFGDEGLSRVKLEVEVAAEPALMRADTPEFFFALVRKDEFDILTDASDTTPKKVNRFRPARFREVTLRLHLGNGYQREYRLEDCLYDPKSKPLRLADLANWIRE